MLLTQLKAGFHVGTATVGLANIPIGAGQFIAFFAVLQADRVGRRPILLWSIVGYTVCTTLTAASWDIWSFACFQFGAQVFIGAEFGVAVTLLAEEVPPERRGRALSLLLLVSPVGAVVAGGLVAVGFLHNPLGWRAFYLVAALPLVVAAAGRRRLDESRAWRHAVAGRPPEPASLGRVGTSAAAFWRAGPRRPAALLGGIAFLQGLVTAGVVGWWTYYAEHQRHLGTATAGAFFAAAAVVSVGGYVVCGRLMDRIGRRATGTLYSLVGVACAVGTFQVADRWVMLPLLLGTAFFGVGSAPVISALTAELFPTELRAQGSAWVRNGFGNTGSVAGPAMVGVLGASSGLLGTVGWAGTALALAYLGVVPLLWLLPETRQAVLEPG